MKFSNMKSTHASLLASSLLFHFGTAFHPSLGSDPRPKIFRAAAVATADVEIADVTTKYIDPDDRHDKDIDDLVAYYRDSNNRRAHAIAPPGYGKTLFSLGTMVELCKTQKHSMKIALYVVPRLNLADQVLESCDTFGVFRDLPHKRIIVGSRTNRREQRTTKAEVIADFLTGTAGDASSKETGMHFVVSTYESLPRVGEALRLIQAEQRLPSPPSIDFAIFDEAHRTEGGSKYTGYGLYDENIHIEQRLFVTATPVNYTDTPVKIDVIGRRNTNDGSLGLVTKSKSSRIEVRSINNKDLYGPCIVQKASVECIADGITVPI